jgi:hypothetical protein
MYYPRGRARLPSGAAFAVGRSDAIRPPPSALAFALPKIAGDAGSRSPAGGLAPSDRLAANFQELLF